MRLLLVKDKADFAKNVESAVRAIPDVELVWAASRDSALARLQAEHFDLVLLDRSIPTADGVLGDHPEYGWRVFQHLRETLPGVPVWFLTGAEDHEFAANLNNDFGRTANMHGKAQAEPMYLVCWKKSIADCVRRIKTFAASGPHWGELQFVARKESICDPKRTPSSEYSRGNTAALQSISSPSTEDCRDHVSLGSSFAMLATTLNGTKGSENILFSSIP